VLVAGLLEQESSENTREIAPAARTNRAISGIPGTSDGGS